MKTNSELTKKIHEATMYPSIYSIQRVAELTGLTEHTIRAWEKRYQAVIPRRTENGRRIYDLNQVERLKKLYQLTLKGQSIGKLAKHTDSWLDEALKQQINNPKKVKTKLVKSDVAREALLLSMHFEKLDVFNYELSKISEANEAKNLSIIKDVLVNFIGLQNKKEADLKRA